MKINNRRYIGAKTKLLDFIYNSIQEVDSNKNLVFADIFAGTGTVANYFAQHGYKTIINDTLFSNIVAYNAWLGDGDIDTMKIEKKLAEYNLLNGDSLNDNYFSEIYGGKYFTKNDAKKIGYIRELVEDEKDNINQREYYYLLASLLYAADKVANTVGHFESFLSKEPQSKGLILLPLEIDEKIVPATIHNMDANMLVKQISCDIAYIDPPYNARQYVNFYHVLENLARWNKPTEFEGKSMKFKRQELKSDYCRNKAPLLMKDLIDNIRCKIIAVSYNNTYKAGSTSSVNTISAEQLIEMLKRRGKVTVKEIDYKAFSAGKTALKGHKELLYICEVTK